MTAPAEARAPVIDFHVHMLEPEVFRASTNKTVFTGFGANPMPAPRPGAAGMMQRMFDAEAVIADLDARGIDVGVISSSTVLQGTSWADPASDAALCRRCNEQAVDWQSRYPARFVGSMVLPLQAPGLALAELRRAADEDGLRVVNAASSYAGAYLGDARFDAFWAEVARRGLVVWIHPEGVRDPWFQDYALWNSLGQSIEEAKVMASLIYSGVMARYPELKVVIAHGGGYFPHYLGRMDRNTANRPDTARNIGGRRPSEFLRAFHYDACVYDPAVLMVLIERVGADRLVMGSDYPVGEADPLGWLRACGVAGDDWQAIAGGNAARLLGLAAAAPTTTISSQ
ncbi:MAG: amidohydrolase [Burkholderiales bacterium]|nr:amidohydrolase [Burkholderiales bacterium]